MSTPDVYRGGENFDLRQILLQGRSLRLAQRTALFDKFLRTLDQQRENTSMREILSAADREVEVRDPWTGAVRRMLMFGSNNYLGFARHPAVIARAQKALRDFGAGIGGPPLLNGTTALHRELEERLAALKGTEDALLFASGYGANVGLVTGLTAPSDIIVYDAYSHASFCDGISMAGIKSFRFAHNDVGALRALLGTHAGHAGETFVGIEGVYSMDGDLAPLDLILPLCHQAGALVILDDAHGSGVMGGRGTGTAEHFGLDGAVDITMATFSKVFAVTGGFVAASRPIVEYLRYFARSHMFSAALPPVVVGTVLGGLDALEREPELLQRLRDNVSYAARRLRDIGFPCHPEAAIIPLRVPVGMNIRKASYRFHELGIFLNSIEYPAVPVSQQRFRISLMATHTHEDIDRLIDAVRQVWRECAPAETNPSKEAA